MEEDDFVAVVPKWLDDAGDGGRVAIEIGKDDYDAAPVEILLEVAEGLGEIGAGATFSEVNGVEEAHQLALAGGGGDVVFHFVVEDDKSGGVALLGREVAE